MENVNSQDQSAVSQSSRPVQPQQIVRSSDPDEINLLEYIYVLIHHKWRIIGLTLLGLVAGHVGALVKGPTWVAEAIIAPRETESRKSPSFAGFGAWGGLVASQLNFGGSASLDKIDLTLGSRRFNADLIEKYRLLPMIYRVSFPKVYKEMYDSLSGKWHEQFERPKPLGIGGFLKSEYLKKEIEKNNTITVNVESPDSAFTDTLLSIYLKHLNDFIKESVQQDAKENVGYLEGQLRGISDPLLREKLQGLIANEVERMMVVSKEAFKVVDPVFVYKRFKEKKLYPLVFGFSLFFLTTLVIVFVHAFTSADKTEEDRRLVKSIRRELFSWPKKRGAVSKS